MDQQNHEMGPSLDLPKPQSELPASYPDGVNVEQRPMTEQGMARSVEQGVSSPMPPAQQQAQPAQSPAVPTQQALPPQQVQAQPVGMPQIADDIDLIEKEWVAKAKEIVSQTRHDPRSQTNEMSKVRAEYIKKRYNREMKLTEE